MQESWEEWRREGKLAKSTMEVRETQFVRNPRRKKGYLYSPSKNLTVVVPGGGISGSSRGGISAPPDFLGKNPPKNPPTLLGVNHQKFEGHQHKNGDNFCI
jgi:hypothetical protein